jgi:hypothetical protein
VPFFSNISKLFPSPNEVLQAIDNACVAVLFCLLQGVVAVRAGIVGREGEVIHQPLRGRGAAARSAAFPNRAFPNRRMMLLGLVVAMMSRHRVPSALNMLRTSAAFWPRLLMKAIILNNGMNGTACACKPPLPPRRGGRWLEI